MKLDDKNQEVYHLDELTVEEEREENTLGTEKPSKIKIKWILAACLEYWNAWVLLIDFQFGFKLKMSKLFTNKSVRILETS